uniref:hypothetical protein n=1 Tax=Desulfonatronum thiodismutans TaxID=159290 RepID=UPI0004ABEB8F|nr:hypothetical protein [Desulfonatronum thiodismutans]
MPPSTIFALLDCNNFYASCERAFNPKLRGRLIVVLSFTSMIKQPRLILTSLAIIGVTKDMVLPLPVPPKIRTIAKIRIIWKWFILKQQSEFVPGQLM